jgi:hypothetical protein
MRLYVSKGRGEGAPEREFNAANAYKKKMEAIEHCIEFGKQIVDGKVEAFTVADL